MNAAKYQRFCRLYILYFSKGRVVEMSSWYLMSSSDCLVISSLVNWECPSRMLTRISPVAWDVEGGTHAILGGVMVDKANVGH